MARSKNYRYKMTVADGPLPKKGFLYMETGNPDIAVYSRLLRGKEISRYKLTDLNTDVKKLTIYRTAAGLRQVDLSALTGISIKTIQSWEIRGMNAAGLKNALKVADVLKCNVRDLVEEDDD